MTENDKQQNIGTEPRKHPAIRVVPTKRTVPPSGTAAPTRSQRRSVGVRKASAVEAPKSPPAAPVGSQPVDYVPPAAEIVAPSVTAEPDNGAEAAVCPAPSAAESAPDSVTGSAERPFAQPELPDTDTAEKRSEDAFSKGFAAAKSMSDTKQPPVEDGVTYALKKGEIIGGTEALTEPKPSVPPAAPAQKAGRKKKKKQKAKELVKQSAAVEAAAKTQAKAPEPCSDDTPKEKESEADKAAAGKPSLKPLSFSRLLIMIPSAALMLFSFSPLLVGVLTVGILPPLCIGAFCFFSAFYWPRIRDCKNRLLNALFVMVSIIVFAGVMGMSYLSGEMIAASRVAPSENGSSYTVLVLGCKIIGDRPSLMLTDRLNAAADYLQEHPSAYCIVSGGQGDDEQYPESQIMKKYLIDKGISRWRIVEENASDSTRDNVYNSKELIDSCNLHEDVIIVTDRFHQYRARYFAQKAGIRSYAVNVETRWFLSVQYWFKEMAAILRMWVFGV